jgi:hypothetical protein
MKPSCHQSQTLHGHCEAPSGDLGAHGGQRQGQLRADREPASRWGSLGFLVEIATVNWAFPILAVCLFLLGSVSVQGVVLNNVRGRVSFLTNSTTQAFAPADRVLVQLWRCSPNGTLLLDDYPFASQEVTVGGDGVFSCDSAGGWNLDNIIVRIVCSNAAVVVRTSNLSGPLSLDFLVPNITETTFSASLMQFKIDSFTDEIPGEVTDIPGKIWSFREALANLTPEGFRRSRVDAWLRFGDRRSSYDALGDSLWLNKNWAGTIGHEYGHAIQAAIYPPLYLFSPLEPDHNQYTAFDMTSGAEYAFDEGWADFMQLVFHAPPSSTPKYWRSAWDPDSRLILGWPTASGKTPEIVEGSIANILWDIYEDLPVNGGLTAHFQRIWTIIKTKKPPTIWGASGTADFYRAWMSTYGASDPPEVNRALQEIFLQQGIPVADDAYELPSGNNDFDHASNLGSVSADIRLTDLICVNPDYYRFELLATPTDSNAKLSIDFDRGKGHLSLYLFDASRQMKEANMDVPTGSGMTSLPIYLTGRPPGVYYAVVTGEGDVLGTASRNEGDSSPNYMLEIKYAAPPGNQPPTVSAGPTVNVRFPATANLTGSFSDDGLPNPPGQVTVSWQKSSGPGSVTFGNPAAAVTTASFSAPGTYVLQLSASDGALSATSTVSVMVSSAANLPPVVEAGPDQNAVINVFTATATLSGSILDDGLPNPPGVVTCLWSKVSGPGNVVLSPATAPVTAASFDAVGSYVLRLFASDGQLGTNDTVGVTVSARSQQKITGLTPSWGPNNGTTHITELAGDGFAAGTTVKLVTLGRPDITGANVVVVSSTKITCDFNLLGAAAGARDVVVSFPDGKTGTLLSGFTVGDVLDGGAEPNIVIGSGGVAHIAYLRDYTVSGSASYVKYTRIVNSTWTTDIVATSPNGESYASTWIGLDGSGNPHIGYVELYGNGRVVHCSKSGSWSSETVEAGTSTDLTVGFDGMAMAISGSALDFVYEKRTGTTTIKDSNRWARKSGSYTFGSLNADYFNGSVAARADSSGNTHLLYLINTDLKYRQRTSGGWQGEESVQTGVGAWYHGRPGLAVDASGNVHAVYAGSSDGNKPRYAKRTGTTWSTPVVIDGTANCDGSFARIACAPDGTLYAAYYNNGTLRLAKNSGSGWQIRDIESMDEYGGPDIAVDSQGVVHLAYGKANKLSYLRVPTYQRITFTVTPVGSGTTVPAPGSYFYERGSTNVISCLASNGWVFDHWSGDVQGTNVSMVITNDADKLVTANFVLQRILTDTVAVDVPEGGSNAFRIKLSAPPTGSTAVSVSRLDGETNLIVRSGSALSFDTSNWNTYQTVILSSAVDSDALDGQARIRCSGSGCADAILNAFHRDAQFHSLITDQAAVTVPEGGVSTLRVKLSSQPDSDLLVSVSFSSGPTNFLVQAGGTLTFTPLNWDTFQIVTIASLPDSDIINDQGILRCNAAGWTGKEVAVTQLDSGVPPPSPPVLSSLPSSLVVPGGRDVWFWVAASGSGPFHYQWTKNGTNLLGAIDSGLLLTNVTRRDSGLYGVLVTNLAGATPSSNWTLVVRVPQRLGAAMRPSAGGLALNFGDADGGLLTAGDLAGFEILASTNLLDWTTLSNAVVLTNGQALMIDTSCTNRPLRFYRVVEP